MGEHRPDQEADAVPRLVDPSRDHQPDIVHDLGRGEVLVGPQHVEEAARLRAFAEFVEPGQHRFLDGPGGTAADGERRRFLLEVGHADAEPFAPVPHLPEIVGIETENGGERPGAHQCGVAADDVRFPVLAHGLDQPVAERREFAFGERAAPPRAQERRLHCLLEPGAGGRIQRQHVHAQGAGQKARLGRGAEDRGLVLHRLDIVPAGHEPHPERRNPGDRLLLPQAGEHRIRIPVERLGGDRFGEFHGKPPPVGKLMGSRRWSRRRGGCRRSSAPPMSRGVRLR